MTQEELLEKAKDTTLSERKSSTPTRSIFFFVGGSLKEAIDEFEKKSLSNVCGYRKGAVLEELKRLEKNDQYYRELLDYLCSGRLASDIAKGYSSDFKSISSIDLIDKLRDNLRKKNVPRLLSVYLLCNQHAILEAISIKRAGNGWLSRFLK